MTRSRFAGAARAPAAGPHPTQTRSIASHHDPSCEPLEPRTLLSAFVVTGTRDSGGGSLRQAILDANANPGPDEIQFNILWGGVHRIHLNSPLPEVTGPTTIDATTQPGYLDRPLVELDGSRAGPDADGLVLLGRPSVVRGLAINRFSRHGVVFREFSRAETAQPLNLLEASYVGLSAAGDGARPNGGAGVLVAAPFTRVRQKNVISGNAGPGVWIVPELGTSLASVTVEQNYIGTDAAGERAVGNGGEGVLIDGLQRYPRSAEVLLLYNVVSGNGASGIRVSHVREGYGSRRPVTLAANRVGTNAAGNLALPNGTSPAAAWRDGVTSTDGSVVFVTAVPGVSERNLVSGNMGAGIRATSGSNVWVGGAYVGTDLTGNASIGNGGDGIVAEQAMRLTVTGAVVSGNGGDGVRVVGVVATPSDPSKVSHNTRIGMSADGTKALGNAGNGVTVRASRNVQKGSLPPPPGPGWGDLPYPLPPNYIGGNGGDGVRVEGDASSREGASLRVYDNRVGFGLPVRGADNRTTAPAIGNGGSGIRLVGINGVKVDSNTIGNNRGDGITVGAAGAASSRNRLENNDVGVSNFTSAAPDAGNAGNGVTVVEGNSNVITGDVRYNDGDGVTILKGDRNTITGTVADNAGDGVVIRAGDGNRIECQILENSGSGALIAGGKGNSVLGYVSGNGGLPIDLAPAGVRGVTPNDPLDPDDGPNDLQNFPIIQWAQVQPKGGGVVSYSFNSKPQRSYRVRFFVGGRSAGHIDITTDAGGNAAGISPLLVRPGDARPVAATATDLATGDTSEFSPAVAPVRSVVAGAYFFYNNSGYDGLVPEAALGDGRAIAPDRTPTYIPGAAGTLHYTTYDKGINGIILDLTNTPSGGMLVTPDDFLFVVRDKVTEGGVLIDRARPAPPPSSIALFREAGVNRSHRLMITWPDGAIRNAWLEVTVLPRDGTPERPLYFGNLVGDAWGFDRPVPSNGRLPFRVNALDLAYLRASPGPAGIGTAGDINRDGAVNALDLAAVRANLGTRLELFVQPIPT